VGKEKLFFREKYANYKNVEGMTKWNGTKKITLFANTKALGRM
jgi:hypothetical protein